MIEEVHVKINYFEKNVQANLQGMIFNHDPMAVWRCSTLLCFVFQGSGYTGLVASKDCGDGAWLQVAHVLYMESPIDTGFSYTTDGDHYINDTVVRLMHNLYKI